MMYAWLDDICCLHDVYIFAVLNSEFNCIKIVRNKLAEISRKFFCKEDAEGDPLGLSRPSPGQGGAQGLPRAPLRRGGGRRRCPACAPQGQPRAPLRRGGWPSASTEDGQSRSGSHGAHPRGTPRGKQDADGHFCFADEVVSRGHDAEGGRRRTSTPRGFAPRPTGVCRRPLARLL